MSAITLRGYSADARALHRLAALDSADPLTGEILAVEQDGEVRAAIALGSRRVIADPFHPTVELVELLETRAAQIHSGQATPRARVRSRLRGIGDRSVAARAT